MNNNELLKGGRMLALKIFAEAFLMKDGNPNVDKLYANRKLDSNAELTDGEAYVLHGWLMDDYKSKGLDLKKIIEEKGEVIEPNKLTNFELNELVKRADELLVQLSVFKKYLEANGKII